MVQPSEERRWEGDSFSGQVRRAVPVRWRLVTASPVLVLLIGLTGRPKGKDAFIDKGLSNGDGKLVVDVKHSNGCSSGTSFTD